MLNRHLSLTLNYESPAHHGRPIPVARIADPELIVRVADAALRQADARVGRTPDVVLSELERAEVARLRQMLTVLVPCLNSAKTRRPTRMARS